MQVRLVVQSNKKEKKAEDTGLVEGACNQPCHERPEVSVGCYSVEPNIRREADVSPHEDLVAQGLRLLEEKEESNGYEDQDHEEVCKLVRKGLVPSKHLSAKAVIKGLILPVIMDIDTVEQA